MTIASEITKSQTNLSNCYTAVNTKGGTLPASQNFDNLATAIGTIGGSSGKYKLLDRVKDDSNNEIGSVSGFFKDANDVEYAVVCIDAQYRLASGAYCSDISAAITNLPVYTNQTLWSATETATFNTQKILDYCTAQSATSTSCTHCRSKSFTIGGVTYYGQLPNIAELSDIFRRRVGINSADTSSSSYSSLLLHTGTRVWSSSQYSVRNGWFFVNNGAVNYTDKTTDYMIIPVLEIPNQ